MASYLDKLRDIVEDWDTLMDILQLNSDHLDIVLNEAYSVIEASDYAEEQLMDDIHREITHQARIEEMI